MVDGFWLVQYEGIQGGGGGVVFLAKGKVLGGDSGYAYFGTFNEANGSINAQIKVQSFLPGVPNVLGLIGDFELELDATVEGDVARGTATLLHQNGVGIAVKLTKRAPLP
jgi:hypothetical protein